MQPELFRGHAGLTNHLPMVSFQQENQVHLQKKYSNTTFHFKTIRLFFNTLKTPTYTGLPIALKWVNHGNNFSFSGFIVCLVLGVSFYFKCD